MLLLSFQFPSATLVAHIIAIAELLGELTDRCFRLCRAPIPTVSSCRNMIGIHKL